MAEPQFPLYLTLSELSTVDVLLEGWRCNTDDPEGGEEAVRILKKVELTRLRASERLRRREC